MSKQSLNTVTPWWIYTCIPGLLIKLGSIHIITFVCLQLLIYLKGGLKGEPRGSRGASVFYLISLYDIWIIRNLSKTFINISFQPIFFKFSSRSFEALNSNNIFHRSFYILKIFPKPNTILQFHKILKIGIEYFLSYVITSFEIPSRFNFNFINKEDKIVSNFSYFNINYFIFLFPPPSNFVKRAFGKKNMEKEARVESHWPPKLINDRP